MTDTDIQRTAWLMICRHGDNAVAEAIGRGDAMLDKGDVNGLLVWMAIIRAIERLQATEPADGEAVQ
jgi:hypothetical protein